MYRDTGDPKKYYIFKIFSRVVLSLEYLKTREEEDGGVVYGIGDWVYYKTKTPTAFTSTCFYWLDNTLMAKFADLTGHDAAPYSTKADQLKELINTKYFDADRGLYSNGSMCALGEPLYLGLVPEEHCQRVADNLARKVIENDYVLDFGSMGSKCVLRMLSKYGYGDVAYKLASGTKEPSWCAWIEKGYTTLPETWVVDMVEYRDASLDHVFLGDITAWFVNGLAGINFDEAAPGFSHVNISPDFVEGLDYASASYMSVRGPVESSWKRSGSKVTLTVKLPENTRGTVKVRGYDTVEIGPGKTKLKFSSRKREAISVLTYNIRYGTAPDGDNSWEFRKPSTIAMIKVEKPDVFGLQEALGMQIEYISAECPSYGHVGVPRDDGVSEGEIMAVFYNTDTQKLLDWGTFWLSETPDEPSKGWDAMCRRTATWTLFQDKASGRKYYFVDTHLDHCGSQARLNGLALIVDRIAQINPKGFPMVLCGDFNVEPDDPCLNSLEGKMFSVRNIAQKSDRHYTFNAWGDPDMTETIDYVFERGFGKAVSFETLTGKYAGIPYISDHFPVKACLEF